MRGGVRVPRGRGGLHIQPVVSLAMRGLALTDTVIAVVVGLDTVALSSSAPFPLRQMFAAVPPSWLRWTDEPTSRAPRHPPRSVSRSVTTEGKPEPWPYRPRRRLGWCYPLNV